MPNTKEHILSAVRAMKERNERAHAALTDEISVEQYADLVTTAADGCRIWTRAFQSAVDEHEVIYIPDRGEAYYIDQTLIIPSGRKLIAAPNAHIKKVATMDTLLLRNRHVHDGTGAPLTGEDKDKNISVFGGIWEDTDPHRVLHHGKYDSENSMPGINACMFFNNIEQLNLRNIKIIQAGGFGIQIGYATDVTVEDILFEKTVADGVHLNGHTRCALIKNIRGSVADDIVAFNMYDWQNSSVCFGPIERVLCEDIALAPESCYKAIRVLPGTYTYADGTVEDCFIRDVIIRRVTGISTFKFYFQTPPYTLGSPPEAGSAGEGDRIFIEDVDISLDTPIDPFEEYTEGDPVLGSFAAFEFGSFFGRVEMKNIKLRLDTDRFPTAYFLCIGPKSVRRGGKEIFDPYENSTLSLLCLQDIQINGMPLNKDSAAQYIHAISFDTLYGGTERGGRGKIREIRFL